MHLVGTLLTSFDVYSDYQTGWEHWENGHHFWALTTWILMFAPAMLSFIIGKPTFSFKISSLDGVHLKVS